MTGADIAAEDGARARVAGLVAGIHPFDERERADLATASGWISGGAPLWRTVPPDIPPTHLVSYFVLLDRCRGELLLVAHRKAGLWLPTGGHVEPGEDPWDTVRRECVEELGVPAVAHPAAGQRPVFLTVTGTRGAGPHTDVSLWYLLVADASSITSHDQGEFAGIRWLTPQAVLDEPVETLDPQMHRVVRKLVATLGG
ncbi:MAG TPA: NUDIX domain-containing protein [Micromonospora sp.]